MSFTRFIPVFIFAGIALVALFPQLKNSQASIPHEEKKLVTSDFTLPNVSAKSFFVFDMETGKKIGAKNENTVLPIASVSKLITAALVLQQKNIDATTSIKESDIETEGRAGKLKVTEVYSFRELLFPLLLESSNDAATALLRSDSHLLQKMNDFTHRLGLKNSHFEDTSGLSDKNVSTAFELSVILRNLFTTEPHLFDITRLTQYIGTYTGWGNNNPLVQQDGYQGGKHGYTALADRTAVAVFKEDSNGHIRTFGYVLLKSDTVLEDIKILRAEVREKVRFQ